MRRSFAGKPCSGKHSRKAVLRLPLHGASRKDSYLFVPCVPPMFRCPAHASRRPAPFALTFVQLFLGCDSHLYRPRCRACTQRTLMSALDGQTGHGGRWRSLPLLTPSTTLHLRNSGHPQAFSDALAPGKIGRVIALRVEPIATNGEGRIERKSSLNGGLRLF